MDETQNLNDFQVREVHTQEPQTEQAQPRPPQKQKLGLISLFTKKNLPKTIIVIVLLVVLIAAAAVIWGRTSFSKGNISVEIKIEGDIASGEEVNLIVKYKNKNRVSLNDVYLFINYPSGTFSSEGDEINQEEKKLGMILAKSEGEEKFKIRLIGEKGDIKNVNAKLNYKPQNINSRFENSSSLRIEINSVVIAIDIEGSEKTISGQEVNYVIEYENKTDKDISDLRLELEYPKDFQFISATPEPMLMPEDLEKKTNNVWEINQLKPDQKKTINLKGVLRGEEGENKVLKATVGMMRNDVFLKYSQYEYITRISPPPLLIDLEIRDIDKNECNLNTDQRLNYKITFKNNTDIALSELVLRAYFEGNVFDFKNIELGGAGFFDSGNNTITWSGAEVPVLNLLEPNQSGEVNFSISIKKSLPIFSSSDKNFQAQVLAEIETLTIPAKFSVSELKVSKELTCKLNSQLDLDTKVYYYEPNSGIINTGPIPPKVGELTHYTVHWQIANISNALENVRIYAILPQGIEWSNYFINNVSDSDVSYNERTKEITWKIDKVPAGVGVISPMYELIFQIGLRPSINQVDDTPTLINESSIEGKDAFTGVILKDFTPEINTSLPDDIKIDYNKRKVRE